jgi:hypothetical protein
MTSKKFQITDIEFDLTDDCGEYIDTEMLQGQLQKAYTKTSWDVDDHEDLLEQISYKSGWSINSIQYDEVK